MESETQTQAPEGEKPQGAAADTGTGDKSKTEREIEKLEAKTAKLNKAIAEKKDAEARAQLAGVTEGKTPEVKPKEQTSLEYMEDVMSGKLNPKE